jgi:O-antigen/teichoic acid export membrane protein
MAEIVGAVVLLVMEWRIIRIEMPGTRLVNFGRPRQFREGLKMMRELWLSATLWGLELEMYIPFLALLSSPEQVGIFRSGVDIAETIEKLLVPFMLVLFPQIVKSYEQDSRPQFLRLTRQSGWLMALLTVPFTLGIMFLGPIFLPRLLSDRYAGVATVATLIAIGYTAYGIFMWTRPALVALSRIRALNLIGMGMIGVAALTLLVSLPTFGAIGAAGVRGGSMILQYGISFLVFRRIIAQQQLPSEMQTTSPPVPLTGLAQDHAR